MLYAFLALILHAVSASAALDTNYPHIFVRAGHNKTDYAATYNCGVGTCAKDCGLVGCLTPSPNLILCYDPTKGQVCCPNGSRFTQHESMGTVTTLMTYQATVPMDTIVHGTLITTWCAVGPEITLSNAARINSSAAVWRLLELHHLRPVCRPPLDLPL
jgi:hypothetical protein